MEKKETQIKGKKIEIFSLNTVIVGSGAAGLNAADRLYSRGQQDIAVVTEGLKKGTSRNTGSDKQTYYKLTLSGKEKDSVYDMAKTLFDGGSMDGDIALAEASLSVPSFFHLVEIGVPFPHNRFGEYVGYKTDHDPRQRATSAGPLTSRFMTEKLEKQVKQKNIKIFDGYQVIGILTDDNKNSARGLIALNLNKLNQSDQGYVIFNCTNIVYATGGPAGMYEASVYPESQTGASGLAFEAGVKGKNLTESQYGIASIDFRWNLSGTYQQVLPRYVSTRLDKTDEREFLKEYFEDPGKMLDAIFLKGYQWPFDPGKIENYGSSLIDILVYYETVVKNRKVWLDFTKNSDWAGNRGKLDFSLLGPESYNYLKNSDSLFGTPVERLKKMNQPAIDLYKENGIDLNKDYLEIAVCAQHNNGGLSGNMWWESNVDHLFPVGEVNGTHGIYRPGGSALNSGQAGSTRAAQYISANYNDSPPEVSTFLNKVTEQINEKISLGEKFINDNNSKGSSVKKTFKKIGKRMTENGAHIRSLESVKKAARKTKTDLKKLPGNTSLNNLQDLGKAYKNYDLLISQYVYLSAIKNYIENGGKSRGSYLIYDNKGRLPGNNFPEEFRYSLSEEVLADKVQLVSYSQKEGCEFEWRPVRPLPDEDSWFEKVWERYRKNEVFKDSTYF
ncbi:MAG: FAD-binding protein [Halanaerobiaceae bacterium]